VAGGWGTIRKTLSWPKDLRHFPQLVVSDLFFTWDIEVVWQLSFFSALHLMFSALNFKQYYRYKIGWGDNWIFQKKVKFVFAHPGNG
jgi:hypothetical protein